MPLPTHDEQGRELLPEDEYNRIAFLDDADRAKEPADVLTRYEHTRQWHYERRLGHTSNEGVSVGGQTFQEALAEARAAKARKNAPPAP